jgi:hypothetical protein
MFFFNKISACVGVNKLSEICVLLGFYAAYNGSF